MKRVGILTGGGDCPGLNPAIRGCVMRSIDHGYVAIGLSEGWRGLVEGKTTPLNADIVDDIICKGGTILGTSRTNPFKKEGAVQKCLDNMKKLKLDALIVMGGEDTLGVANRLYKEHKVNVVGVPKTMDNDLSATDFTFGFDTSVTVAVEAAERLRDTGMSHRRIMVFEVMGRHAGWVALYTAIASAADWALLPEQTVDIEVMCKHLKEVHARNNVALLVVSEGVQLPEDKNQKEELDEFGHMILKKRGIATRLAEIIEKKTGAETRTAVIGHMQRGGPPTLFDRMLGTRVGVAAADLVSKGSFGKMVALKGEKIVPVSLDEAIGTLKVVPSEWIDFMKIFFK